MNEKLICPDCHEISVNVYNDISPNFPRYICENCNRVWNTNEWKERNNEE